VKHGRLCTIREGAADKGQGALRLGTCRSHSTLKGRVRQRRSSAASARPPFSQARRCFAQDAGSTEHQAALAAVHRECAAQLLRLCQANGGVYIKAAQLVSTIQSVPKEYRECAPGPSYSQRASCACKRPHLGGLKTLSGGSSRTSSACAPCHHLLRHSSCCVWMPGCLRGARAHLYQCAALPLRRPRRRAGGGVKRGARARRTLEVLQDRVDPRPFEETRRMLERELGAPVAELFAELEPHSRAAASLAQVAPAPLRWPGACLAGQGWRGRARGSLLVDRVRRAARRCLFSCAAQGLYACPSCL